MTTTVKPIEEFQTFIDSLPANNDGIYRRREINKALEAAGVSFFRVREVLTSCQAKKDDGSPYKGVYDLSQFFDNLQDRDDTLGSAEPVNEELLSMATAQKPASTTSTMKSTTSIQRYNPDNAYVPSIDRTYVRWGASRDVATIIASGEWFPTYITGHSGNGKTMMVEQACARAKREFVRVQISPETDEDDLIGGMRLSEYNGATVTEFVEGPVVRAMRSGAILLVDEIDRGTNKIMCLQGVLEGKAIMIKKTGEVVTPTKGFNVIATSNTKGRGSDDGRYIAASIIDDAFLERFTITIDQPFASPAIEKKIVSNHFKKFGLDPSTDENVNNIEHMVLWAKQIRDAFNQGGIDEVITTRRLCHITHTFSIFKDMKKSVELCISRFDADASEALGTFWEASGVEIATAVSNAAAAEQAAV